MKHRCPWCGEIVSCNNTLFVFGSKCEHCGNCYKAYRKTPVYIIFTIITFIVIGICIVSDIEYGTFMTIIMYGMINLSLMNCPYEKETTKFISQKRFKADIDFFYDSCTKIKFPRLTVIENQIFTVCFVDENDKPMSDMICAATENVKWKNKKCSCILAFLPLGKLDIIYPSGTAFYIFFNKKKVGKGVLNELVTNLYDAL